MDYNETIEKLLRIIMCDWQYNDGRATRCQWCNEHQRRPKIERHWKKCPRLIWATANNETPGKRARKFTAGKIGWDDDLEIIPRGHFYNEGETLYNILQCCLFSEVENGYNYQF